MFVDLVANLVKFDSMPAEEETKNTAKQILAIKYLDICLETGSLAEIYLFEVISREIVLIAYSHG